MSVSWRAALALLVSVPMLAMVGGSPAQADPSSRPGTFAERPRDAAVHAVDGEVHSLAQVGGSVVFGGNFTQVGPVTRGAAGIVDTTTKTFGTSFPDVAGAVNVAISDGAGGWYLGGSFDTVGGQPRHNLAQVDSGGSVTSFDPSPNGAVNDLVLGSGRLVVGGAFTTIAGQPAGAVASLTPAGAFQWGATVTGGAVRAVALSAAGDLVYVGGDFSQVGGVVFRRLAALDAATGVRNTMFAVGTPNQPVTDLVVRSSGELLFVGSFTAVGGVSRVRIAQVDGTTGALGTLNVSVNNTVNDVDVDEASGTAYLAGTFGTVGGLARTRLAGVSLSGAGAVTALSVPAISGNLSAVTLDGAGGLFIGGAFQVTPEKDNPAQLARVAIATNAVTTVVPYYATPRSLARTPRTGTSGVLTLARQGGSLMVAGDFSDYGTTGRSGLAAYDLATGALRSDFNPSPDGQVNTVKASANGQAVFVGGEFNTMAGESHKAIAKLDMSTGLNVPGFNASASSYVKDLAVRTDGSTVYVGGNFDQFDGVPTSRLLAMDATTGAILPGFAMPLTNPTNDFSEGGLRAMALSPDETRLMVIGNFRTIAGVDRPLIAQIDVSGPTATVTDWHTDLYDQPCARSGKIGFMRDVDISPDGQRLYSVSAGHFYYPACDSLNAWSMTPSGGNQQPLWTKKIGDTMEAVAADRDAVYLSGHFRYLETETRTQPRFQIAAVDPLTGEGLNWVPNAGGFRGVLALELEPAGLFAGSDGDAFGGVNHGRNSFWPNPSPGVEVRAESTRPWVLAPSGTVSTKVRVQNTFSDRSVTVTALSDQRLGNLDGSGTCALPQTLAVGEVYSCTTASEAIAGTAATDVSSVVSVTADAGGSTVTDTDTRVVQVIATAPVFRLRAVVGPGAVSFPGETVRFGLTTMNLDLERPVTVTGISSPTFGDVSSDCGLPQVVQPNRLIYCHVNRLVQGSVGSRPSFSFTASGTYDTGVLTSTSSQSVTINPPVGGTKVLAVVADPTFVSGSDSQISNKVDDNYSITYADDNTVQTSDVQPDVSAVLIYPSAVEARLGTRLRNLDVPTLVFHSRMLDEMGMTAVGATGTVTATQWQIDKAMHPLPATRSGTVTMDSASISTGFGTPAAGATVVASVAGGGPTEFAYDTGDAMTTGPAPACRVFFAANNTTKFNSTSWALFNRAVSYTTMDCGKNMLWTAAGNGTTSYPGDGNQSVAVGINTPWGVAIDALGRVYYADSAANVVRRIGTGGVVTTIAGTGTAGSTGDGGQATAARLSAPVRLAFDAAGNLFIADSANNKIRKVTMSTGVITTVAGSGTAGNTGDGGQATSARLRTPYDVAFGPDGSMYIADRANHKIRKVNMSTGVITTFAGNGSSGYNGDEIAATSARLNSPYSVDVDNDGNVYIADYDNERVRLVDTSGNIHTFAGTGVATIDGDGGPATEAGLHKPQYVLATPSGDVWIGESNNNRVRLVRNGQIDTIAGSGQFSYLGDGGPALFSTWSRPSAMAFDAAGNLWVVDRGNRRLRVINAS
jgi:sugar lactone lactonase YvrE